MHRELLQDRLDLIVVPDAFANAGVITTPLAQVENAWAAKPGLVPDHKPLHPLELGQYRHIAQGERAGAGFYYARWMQLYGLHGKADFETCNLLALVGLLNAGAGIGYVPRKCFDQFFRLGYLQEIRLTDPLPPMRYSILQSSANNSSLVVAIGMLAQSCCDFSNLFQRGEGVHIDAVNLLI